MLTKCYYGLFTKIAISITIGVLAGSLWAQDKTLDRDLEPVVLAGSEFPLFAESDYAFSELFLFAYHAADHLWQEIPFQFDERNDMLEYVMDDAGATLDANDELVFMARDAGDRAPLNAWIEDLVSRSTCRYEIGVEDPITGHMGWAYLFFSSTLENDPTVGDYVAYAASNTGNAGEDTVRSAGYEIANGPSGLPTDLMILSDGGAGLNKQAMGIGLDIIDRLTFSARVRVLFSNITVTENNISISSNAVKDGPVRLLVNRQGNLSVSIVNANFNLPLIFYGFTGKLQVPIPNLPVGVNRASEAWSLASGLPDFTIFTAANADGVPLDGNPSNQNPDLNFDAGWVAAVAPDAALVSF
ncbi:hypothetical protein MJD09_27835, partial [bacterium]|nr:hypothetical protein [bacterium]